MNDRLRRTLLAAGVRTAVAAAAAGLAGTALADDYPRGNGFGYYGQKDSHVTPYSSQMQARTDLGWGTDAIFTIGESIDGYTPPGIPDGMYAWKRGREVRVLVNHELTAPSGYPYRLRNGAVLTGARVSFFDIDRGTRRVTDAGPAYDTIYNRAGNLVTGPADLEFGGLNRLCSANGISAWELGFVDDIFFTGEETGGGSEFALDVKRGDLWAVPAMGRAAWESVAVIQPPSHRHVAVIIGDDRGGAPLLLYVGEKGNWWSRRGRNNFLDRNGLAEGMLYVWVADNGDADPSQFNGTGSARTGEFVAIDYYRPDLAGNGNYDELGYATQAHEDALAAAAGAFTFSRPEDVHTNPDNANQVVLASTGRSQLFGGADSWGTTYQIDVSFQWDNGAVVPLADLEILYDGDDAATHGDPADGLRSPDNLVWADNGLIYIQEDRSVGGFGATGEEASIWELDPNNGWVMRVAQMDRNVVAPAGVVDTDPTDIGDWESSGIIDVTSLFPTQPGETLLLGNTQAHSVRGGVIDDENLVQGGQLFFMTYWGGIEP